MNASDFFSMREMILGEDADEIESQMVHNPNPGSSLNPSSVAGGDDKKVLAKPHAQIAIKQGEKNFNISTAQHIENEKKKDILTGLPPTKVAAKEEAKKKVSTNDIWNEDEVKDLPIQKNDHRQRPEIETLFKQKVGTEDVYFGMNNIDPTSTKCQELLVKIYMPNSTFREVQIDVNSTGLVVQSPKYYAHHIFPYQVKDKEGKAQWITDKQILQLTLPIIREELY